jgi:hypothetical protein
MRILYPLIISLFTGTAQTIRAAFVPSAQFENALSAKGCGSHSGHFAMNVLKTDCQGFD